MDEKQMSVRRDGERCTELKDGKEMMDAMYQYMACVVVNAFMKWIGSST